MISELLQSLALLLTTEPRLHLAVDIKHILQEDINSILHGLSATVSAAPVMAALRWVPRDDDTTLVESSKTMALPSLKTARPR